MNYKAITMILTALAVMQACSDRKHLKSIEAGNIAVTHIERNDGATTVRAILERSRAAVDSIKAPVIGTAAVELAVYPPESPLMNFAADALRLTAQQHSDTPIDIAITNKGGLRSTLAQGTITFGDIYSVFPFENTLALLTLNGNELMQLFAEIAKVKGEAISGARLTISATGELLTATVGGQPVVPEREYRIATSDYLSQGNDKMNALALGSDREIKSEITIRDLMVMYIKALAADGKALSAECDGRITVQDNK